MLQLCPLLIMQGHGLVSSATSPMVVRSDGGRNPAAHCTLGVSEDSWSNLLFRILFSRISDTRINWASGNSSCGTLPSGGCPLARTLATSLVRADSSLVFEWIRNAERSVLGGNACFRTVVP